ncbi:hypothetical protein AArcMg_0529 [Natrarchaeobaculum sulfurireducens]|uniref:Uncharacterized protein n=1 Tax=Natrarchaeobaculum sulfurireducens TaxID=2044521 RepID=A0A346PM07_9EURY|nr:hypothetical protein AArcMg_0529 [Natrarchaeobaculum sulfurireducens]
MSRSTRDGAHVGSARVRIGGRSRGGATRPTERTPGLAGEPHRCMTLSPENGRFERTFQENVTLRRRRAFSSSSVGRR